MKKIMTKNKIGDNTMKIHKDIKNDMKFLAKSEIRLKILSELNKEPKSVSNLVKETKITYSSVSNNVCKLEKQNLIRRIKNKYYVTPMTKVYYKTLMDFKNSIDMINKHDSFWSKHNIQELSITSIKQITDLKNAKLVETNPIDIYKTHNTIKKQLIKSKRVKAIFPYLHPEYPEIIETILKNGGWIELIVSKSIFKELTTRINRNIRLKAIKNRKLRIYNYKRELYLYLTVSDENMSLGLFKTDGSFDQNRILISNNVNSNIWAEELFEHMKMQVKQ